MQPTIAIQSFHLLGEELRSFLAGNTSNQEQWEQTIRLAEQENAWFTKGNIHLAVKGISSWLEKDKLAKWLSLYPETETKNRKAAIVGVVMAGNIPLVGFHDFLCVLLSGNILHAKLSHSDSRLLQFIASRLIEIEPEWKEKIHFVERLAAPLDAVIATGSNNTARHFEYYFRNIPHIIRKNRNGVALLDGSETDTELTTLGNDIFSYFGLGCRNVSKLYVPKNCIFDNFFLSTEPYKEVINHNKYHSNYVYNRTIYLMDGKKFTDNGFLAVIENSATASPIAVLNFEEYESLEQLSSHLLEIKEQIQCIAVSTKMRDKLLRHGTSLPLVAIGETHSPSLSDYADGVDVMKFLVAQFL
jgi:hypothetical protein